MRCCSIINIFRTRIFIHIHEILTRRHWSIACDDAFYRLIVLESIPAVGYSPRGTASYENAAIEIRVFDYSDAARAI